jgi:hypothetical protein
MTQIETASRRLAAARDLAGVLDAACAAFEVLLTGIYAQQDRFGDAFAAFMMAGASAANGHLAVLAAPSLPRPAPPEPPAAGPWPGGSERDAAAVLAGLSRLLAARLDQAAAGAGDPADEAACAEAARHARAVCARLGMALP